MGFLSANKCDTPTWNLRRLHSDVGLGNLKRVKTKMELKRRLIRAYR